MIHEIQRTVDGYTVIFTFLEGGNSGYMVSIPETKTSTWMLKGT